MAAPKPTMRRKKPSAAALEFIEGKQGTQKTASTSSNSGAKKARAKTKTRAKPKPPAKPKSQKGEDSDAAEQRIPKRLYIPPDVDRELRLRAMQDGVQQSEIATEALRAFLGL